MTAPRDAPHMLVALRAAIDTFDVTDAACRGMDPDMFFPERGASTAEAKAVCAECPVRQPCLEFAVANGEKFGIWGQTSERERRRIRRERATASAA